MQQWLQQCYPHHLLSRAFAKLFKINMDEVLHTDLNYYATFNDFFIRHLQPDARPIADESKTIVSPADGFISQFGKIQQGQLLQAKKINYPLSVLLAGDNELVGRFQQGDFFTVYLSPKDYHRVHMPIAGKLIKMTYVPGKLFSVNKKSVASIPQLFTRNERVICEFATELGKMALILVGATLVAGIHTVWQGAITPQRIKDILRWRYDDKNIVLQRGEEMGHFQYGSTVILLFEPDKLIWNEQLTVNDEIKMGEGIGFGI
jgi:phosphatidylserine decarboxylase